MRYPVSLLLMALCLGTQISVSQGNPPVHAEWDLTFEDEFEGDSVDWTVWESDSASRGSRFPEARWPENNIVRDSILYQVVKHEDPPRGGKSWSAAHIWTRAFTQQYGYFEARIKYGPYLNNAFWVVRPNFRYPEPPHFEIDILEGHTPREITCNYHFAWQHEGTDTFQTYTSPFKKDIPEDVSAKPLDHGFHIYALEWTENLLVWYFDGKPVRVLTPPNRFAPADIRLSTVIMEGQLQRDGQALETVDGSAMEVDWVRVYKKTRDLKEPNYPQAEVYKFPEIEMTPHQIVASATKKTILVQNFDQVPDGALPPGWSIGQGSPAIVGSDRAPGISKGKALRLAPNDYVFYLFDQPIAGMFEVDLDTYMGDLEKSLLFVTLGDFDDLDPNLRKESYYRGDIGAYLLWDGQYISFYPQDPKNWFDWRPFASRQKGVWVGQRFLFDVAGGRFEYFSGTDNHEFRNGGFFREKQKAAHGIGLRHHGGRSPVYIDNLTIRVHEKHLDEKETRQ
ncbi:glycoside hydrolase family 16 protein [bacterium]|nr:glycoside hydrolase family 16 protein [bacterium]